MFYTIWTTADDGLVLIAAWLPDKVLPKKAVGDKLVPNGADKIKKHICIWGFQMVEVSPKIYVLFNFFFNNKGSQIQLLDWEGIMTHFN